MDQELHSNVCDEQIFKGLFSQWGRKVRDFIYYKSGDIGEAEDIVQEVFVKMWQKCKEIPASKAKSFLYTAANNRFLNNVDKKKVRLKYAQSANVSETHKEDPQYELELQEYRARLEQAIADLPDGQREVFLMSRINKMTYSEIAAALDVSVKAVEKRMSKALKKLKDVLNPSGG